MLITLWVTLLFSLSQASENRLIYSSAAIKGSEATFNPISYYFNQSFDTIQNSNWFTQKNFLKNHNTVWQRIKDPIKGTKEGGGLRRLLKDEFNPIAPRSAPNFSLHLVGGGWDFRRLVEWYDAHNYSHPRWWAFFTQYAAAFGNEAMESTNQTDVGAHDHIADLYVYDLVSKVLFLNDDVVLFFRDKAKLHSWPHQPIYNLEDKRINNAATNFIIRPDVFSSDWRPFFHAGMQILAGVSKLGDSQALSLAVGVAPTDPLRNKARIVTALFWDEEGSLLGTFYINGAEEQRFRLNLFPGVIKFGTLSPGFFTALDRVGRAQVGLQAIIPLGAGLSF